jgi:hypothetical protein
MVTQIRKDYRTDEGGYFGPTWSLLTHTLGLVALMGLLKVDGIKIGEPHSPAILLGST